MARARSFFSRKPLTVAYADITAAIAAGTIRKGIWYCITSGSSYSDSEIILEGLAADKVSPTGYFSQARKPVGYVELTGGASGSVDSITVDGNEILSAAVNFNTDLPTTVDDIVTDVNGGVSGYTAAAAHDIVVIYASAAGTAENGDVVASTATTITTSDTNLSGGLDTGDEYHEISYDFTNDFISRRYDPIRANEVEATSAAVTIMGILGIPNPFTSFDWGNNNFQGCKCNASTLQVIYTSQAISGVQLNNFSWCKVEKTTSTGFRPSLDTSGTISAEEITSTNFQPRVNKGSTITLTGTCSGTNFNPTLDDVSSITILDNSGEFTADVYLYGGSQINHSTSNSGDYANLWLNFQTIISAASNSSNISDSRLEVNAQMSFSANENNKQVSRVSSNRDSGFTVTTNAIDFDADNVRYCGQVIITGTETISTINGSASAPDEITIIPVGAVTVTINDSGNIDLTTATGTSQALSGANGDYMVLKKNPSTGNFVEFKTCVF